MMAPMQTQSGKTAEHERGRRPRPRRLRIRFPDALVGVLAFLAVWFLVARSGMVSALALPPPRAVLERVVEDVGEGQLLPAVGQTTIGWGLGLGIGLILGVVWGFALAQSTFLYALFRPYLMFFNAMPRIILAPFAILLFGLGVASKVAVSVSLVVFVVTLGVYGAVTSVPLQLIHSLELMGGNRRTVWRHVVLPGALPYFLGSLRVSVSLALLGVIVGEILVSTEGLGRLIALRGLGFDVEGVFSALVALGVLAAVGNAAIDLLSGRLLKWQSA